MSPRKLFIVLLLVLLPFPLVLFLNHFYGEDPEDVEHHGYSYYYHRTYYSHSYHHGTRRGGKLIRRRVKRRGYGRGHKGYRKRRFRGGGPGYGK